jgi:hypothetical protein
LRAEREIHCVVPNGDTTLVLGSASNEYRQDYVGGCGTQTRGGREPGKRIKSQNAKE